VSAVRHAIHPGAVLPGILLGIGLGGLVDGIALHQLLQWHHMVSSQSCCPPSTLTGLEENTLADGIFHAVTWVVTLAGSIVAVRAWHNKELAPSWHGHAGALIVGWGIFNLLDTLNHVLGFHHIRDDIRGPIGWDIGFFVFALALIGAGYALMRRAPATDRPPA
jgi:uncharacterized membrane protein